MDEGVSTLLATSGDGSLTVMDLRQKKFIQRSDPNESELLSLAIVKVKHYSYSSNLNFGLSRCQSIQLMHIRHPLLYFRVQVDTWQVD